MTREEIEQIIKKNIRTNGRGEITARVMAGVLESFVTYTDSQTAAFQALCEALADSFSALVEEMEGKFESKADALEAAMEAFCTDLLENHFIPWAEGLAGSLSDKMDLTKAAAEAAKTAADGAKASSDLAKEYAQSADRNAFEAKNNSLNAKISADIAATHSLQTKEKIAAVEDDVTEALNIIREGNQDAPAVHVRGILEDTTPVYNILDWIADPAGTLFLYPDDYALALADETEYIYNGQTYIGIVAYAAAKGWNIAENE